MNLFEDLIEELKEENLLESTVTENNRPESDFKVQPVPVDGETTQLEPDSMTELIGSSDSALGEGLEGRSEKSEQTVNAVLCENEEYEVSDESIFLHQNENQEFGNQAPGTTKTDLKNESLVNRGEEPQTLSTDISDANDIQEKPETSSIEQNGTPNHIGEEADQSQVASNAEPESAMLLTESEGNSTDFPEYELLNKTAVQEIEFYRRRANEEVTSLKIVEHILSAIEKEYLKIVPNTYDDLAVSMALHDFLQAGDDPLSEQNTEAEFTLMQETEKWYSALAERDKEIAVSDLRRFTENAKPALSSQALISLARFYRNSPFSETVRAKFDMVLTRLVTRELWDDTRKIVFSRDELVEQLEALYADWSSIPLYEPNEDDSEVLIAVLKFDDFIHEVTNSTSLEELIRSDFFNRVRTFKESTGEKFFAPLLASAAIECNVVVGNQFVKLVSLERDNRGAKEVEEKYNFVLDQPVSESVSKTLKLVELLKEKKEPPMPVVVETPKEIKEEIVFEKGSRAINAEIAKRNNKAKFKVNKFLAALVVLALCALGGLYTWAEFMTPQMKPSPNTKRVSLENSSLKEYFKTARINRETFFAVTDPAWEKLAKEVKVDVLKKMLVDGRDKGYKRIQVLDNQGKLVAFASEKEIKIE